MNNYNTKFKYCQLNARLLVVDKAYQREIQQDRVKRIVANFNPALVNPIKVSHRDGRYYVFDGQHTLASLRMQNHSPSLMVDCKVYEGLSQEDEARLFAEQNGISRAVESIAKFKALYAAGDVDVVEMVRLVERSGFYMDFSKSKKINRITAVAKTYKVFKAVSSSDFIEILSLIKESWEGIPESLNTEIIGGMYLFYKTYKGEYKRKTLVTQLSKVSPAIIIREGKAFSNGGDARFARQILNIYNKNLRTNRLDDKI